MPAVVVTGARQTGKSTLARELTPGARRYHHETPSDPATRREFGVLGNTGQGTCSLRSLLDLSSDASVLTRTVFNIWECCLKRTLALTPGTHYHRRWQGIVPRLSGASVGWRPAPLKQLRERCIGSSFPTFRSMVRSGPIGLSHPGPSFSRSRSLRIGMGRLIAYDSFFDQMIGQARGPEAADRPLAPYEYQRQLALEPWPEMLDIPTGLGKTAAVTAAWLYRRLAGDQATPRRLIWCLPMRVLVEQIRDNVESWLTRGKPLFEEQGLVAPRAYVLMGAETEDDWVARPEDPAILIGTQDMLLSRALMRGYGASRYRWPIDFALLHNDALWVLDEVQLMGSGLTTSAQLEGFRRNASMPVALPSRTLWCSATLRTDWLDTVDFRPHLPRCRVLSLPDADRQDPQVVKRLAASKRLVQARARLTALRKSDLKGFTDELCDEIAAAHTGDAPTLVILNRVGRAQEVYGGLRKRLGSARAGTDLLLVHSRFRGAERARLNMRLRAIEAHDDVIVVATQAVEAGVDLTSRRLFTELAPWASLVQRFGRCNRGGEYEDAVVHWIDIDAAADAELARPYAAEALHDAREVLEPLDSASSVTLPAVEAGHRATHVLRRKDLLDLFNTDPDLSGFDIDISPYLRDPGGADVLLFWRSFDERPDGQPRPGRDELCPVPIGSARDHVRARKLRAYAWSTLDAAWAPVLDLAEIRPGQVLMLRGGAGGYDPYL
jgi:CRISPR-associated endonuclease/helicase Cas3